MAMLADPKRKVKYSIDPRGLAWSKDESKFGQKLMEKMGWKKGKGLGANEDGKTDHVSVRLKSDNKGVGCSAKHADNWIAHQDDFNSLLSSLNQDHPNESTTNIGNETVHSLEAKSKASKARVHYHKFTKGKDLSMRKKEDLDSIFGKRKSASEPATPVCRSEANSDNETNSDSNKHEHGVVTVTSSSSMQEYFAKKMAMLKQTKEQNGSSSGTSSKKDEESQGENYDNLLDDETETRKSKKKMKSKKYETPKDNIGYIETEVSNTEPSSSSKKSKKRKRDKNQDLEKCLSESSERVVENDNTLSPKKNKKCKHAKVLENSLVENVARKSRKEDEELNKEIVNDGETMSNCDKSGRQVEQDVEETSSKKSKKIVEREYKLKQSNVEDDSVLIDNTSSLSQEIAITPKLKKSKKSKKVQGDFEKVSNDVKQAAEYSKEKNKESKMSNKIKKEKSINSEFPDNNSSMNGNCEVSNTIKCLKNVNGLDQVLFPGSNLHEIKGYGSYLSKK